MTRPLLLAILALEGPFVEEGPYRYSRNPQYVGDIALPAGYILLTNSLALLLTGLLAIGWFALAPFAEEPWLRARFGRAYEEYLEKVPRFLGKGFSPGKPNRKQ